MRSADNQVHEPTRDRVVSLALCGLMVAVLAVLSFVAIPLPFSPVSVTLQTVGVFLAGALLGPRWGAVSVFVYVLMGAAGVPVFAGGEAGVGVLLGPKGGYLVGFVAAAFLVGVAARHACALTSPRALAALLAGMIVGTLIIYACGVAWLAVVTGMGIRWSFIVGVLPFLPGDAVKVVASALLVQAIWRAKPTLRS